MVCSLHSVTTGSRDRANVSLIIIEMQAIDVFQFKNVWCDDGKKKLLFFSRRVDHFSTSVGSSSSTNTCLYSQSGKGKLMKGPLYSTLQYPPFLSRFSAPDHAASQP